MAAYIPSSDEEWQEVFASVTKQIAETHTPVPAISEHDLATTSIVAMTIDHTLLKLDATQPQISELCVEAKKFDFASVCVRLPFVSFATSQLAGSSVKVACVVGFHEGTHSTASKVSEAQSAVAAGATELDVVLNRESLQAGEFVDVYEELKAIRTAASEDKAVLKLILETSQLSDEDIIRAGVLAGLANFDFIKTSTGFCGKGASREGVELMVKLAEVVSGRVDLSGRRKKMKIKASGGVRSLEEVKRMILAGAERIGTSSGVVIMRQLQDSRLGTEANTDSSSY